MVDAATLKQHLAYSAWASRKLVEAAAQLSDADRTRDFGTADKSVLGTLVHIFAADRVWLGRAQGHVPARFLDPERDMNMAALQNDWPKILDGWQALLDGNAGAGTGAVISYKDLKGNPYSTPLWQIVLHLVNHASHHRGQVSGFLRAMGHTPPPIDLIFYYRSLS